MTRETLDKAGSDPINDGKELTIVSFTYKIVFGPCFVTEVIITKKT